MPCGLREARMVGVECHAAAFLARIEPVKMPQVCRGSRPSTIVATGRPGRHRPYWSKLDRSKVGLGQDIWNSMRDGLQTSIGPVRG